MKAPIRASAGAVASGLSGIAVLSFAVASFAGAVVLGAGAVASLGGAASSCGVVLFAPGRPVPPDSPSPRCDRA